MKTWIAVGMTFAALTAGCKKKTTGGSDDSVAGPSAFAAWMPKDAAKMWDGAWVTRMHLQSNKKTYTSMAGDPVALKA